VTGRTEQPDALPEDLLETGEEEVFSRAEVEGGRIEHNTAAGRHSVAERDEAQTERQAPDDASESAD
jgi:hypothetical protein